ncbi:hypothetical protein JHK85_000433 [Glycine max]|uniref:Uncharacterized protein n=1 Tax=Glycine soja TaxID=3848 RepID=A0A445LYU4_GLYSO|nr:hypothetical protein JHK87_000432 [Glycine soja]KAG5068056.1 hypothetical protein JHK85_000433 [Glycine max]RZC28456.1 hypothetical protein D0Y65_000439 [Glycine soja]
MLVVRIATLLRNSTGTEEEEIPVSVSIASLSSIPALRTITCCFRNTRNSGEYAVEVTGVSPKATDKDVPDFFAFSGVIENVEIIRCALTRAAQVASDLDTHRDRH